MQSDDSRHRGGSETPRTTQPEHQRSAEAKRCLSMVRISIARLVWQPGQYTSKSWYPGEHCGADRWRRRLGQTCSKNTLRLIVFGRQRNDRRAVNAQVAVRHDDEAAAGSRPSEPMAVSISTRCEPELRCASGPPRNSVNNRVKGQDRHER